MGGGTGGAIFSASGSAGLRYFTRLYFSNNTAGRYPQFLCCLLLRYFFFEICLVSNSCVLILICFFFFIFFFSGSSADITDSSVNVYDHYSKESVVNCSSTSSGVKFYVSDKNLSFDCLLEGNCPTSYFYISSSGFNFALCGLREMTCASIVCCFFFF
jgi:hypothetical protein